MGIWAEPRTVIPRQTSTPEYATSSPYAVFLSDVLGEIVPTDIYEPPILIGTKLDRQTNQKRGIYIVAPQVGSLQDSQMQGYGLQLGKINDSGELEPVGKVLTTPQEIEAGLTKEEIVRYAPIIFYHLAQYNGDFSQHILDQAAFLNLHTTVKFEDTLTPGVYTFDQQSGRMLFINFTGVQEPRSPLPSGYDQRAQEIVRAVEENYLLSESIPGQAVEIQVWDNEGNENFGIFVNGQQFSEDLELVEVALEGQDNYQDMNQGRANIPTRRLSMPTHRLARPSNHVTRQLPQASRTSIFSHGEVASYASVGVLLGRARDGLVSPLEFQEAAREKLPVQGILVDRRAGLLLVDKASGKLFLYTNSRPVPFTEGDVLRAQYVRDAISPLLKMYFDPPLGKGSQVVVAEPISNNTGHQKIKLSDQFGRSVMVTYDYIGQDTQKPTVVIVSHELDQELDEHERPTIPNFWKLFGPQEQI